MNPEKILVIQTAFIGDIILTHPMLSALDARFPNAKIHLLTTPEGAAIHAFNRAVDHCRVFDKKGADRSLGAMRALGKALKEESYDLVVCPHRSLRSGLLARMSGAATRIGYAKTPAGFFMTHRIQREMSRHEARRLLDLLRPLEIDPESEPVRVPLPVIPQAAHAAYKLLLKEGIGRTSYVAIAPGSVWATKRWTPEGFAQLVERLESRQRAYVLIGGPGDEEVERQIAEILGRRPVSLIGQTDLPTLNALIDSAAALVTNDSAPIHLASMNDTPTVAIFGSTVLDFGFGPLARRNRTAQIDLSCRPCGIHGHPQCPKKHFRCMKDLDAQRVLDALDEIQQTESSAEAECG